MITHKFLTEVKIGIVIWRWKLASANEVIKMVTVYRIHICENTH